MSVYVQISPFGKDISHIRLGPKGAQQGCILSPCLFNLQAEYIIRNAELDEL